MKLKVNEIFKTIQGEGRHQGTPVTFIRLSGCTRECKMCDSKYHTVGRNFTVKQMVEEINALPQHSTVVWTGGEPLLQYEAIKEVICKTTGYPNFTKHHLESNGDTVKTEEDMYALYEFQYVCISPKDLKTAKRIAKLRSNDIGQDRIIDDIKVVTDLKKLGTKTVQYATMLMPLTTYDEERDQQIRRAVWEYCANFNLIYSGRMHISVWGKKMKV